MFPEVGWESVPEELLVSIFKNLNAADLVRASKVCTRWNRVFQEPQLWRYYSFGLGSNRKELIESLEVLACIQDNLRKHVREIYIECPKSEIGDRTEPFRCTYLTRLLQGLSKTDTPSMTGLSVRDVFGDSIRGTRRNTANRTRVLQELENVLEHQTQMDYLELRSNFFSKGYSEQVLNSLARSKCLEKLDYLDIVCFFVIQNHDDWTRNQLQNLFTRCQKLAVVQLNFCYLQAVGVETLCESLKNSLEWLIVEAHFPEDDTETIISPQQWRSAVLHCPGLKVGLVLPSWRTDLRMYLVPGIPLVEVEVSLNYEAKFKEELGDIVSWLLDHITRYYSETLELLVMSTDVDTNPVSTPTIDSLARCLFKCHQITKMTFCPKLMTPVLIQCVRSEVGDGLNLHPDIITIN